jgi:hypothetical protein
MVYDKYDSQGYQKILSQNTESMLTDVKILFNSLHRYFITVHLILWMNIIILR